MKLNFLRGCLFAIFSPLFLVRVGAQEGVSSDAGAKPSAPVVSTSATEPPASAPSVDPSAPGGVAPGANSSGATGTTASSSSKTTPKKKVNTTQVSEAAKSAEFEQIRRRDMSMSAQQAIVDGDRLRENGSLDAAAERYSYALNSIPSTGAAAGMYQRAKADLANVKAQLAAQAVAQKDWAKASSLYEQALNLEPDDPNYQAQLKYVASMQVYLEHERKNVVGTVNNPAVTPEFRERVIAVQRLFFEGDAYFNTGQYDRAERSYTKIIALDPYNKAARARLERLDKYKFRAAKVAHDESRQEAMYQVDRHWVEEVPADYDKVAATTETASVQSNLAIITKKLQDIHIKSLTFDDLDIATAIEFLAKKSRELDPSGEGINFVLKLPEEGGAPSAAPSTSASQTAGGASPSEGGASAGASTGGSAPAGIVNKVTLSLKDAPLTEIIGYISRYTNLQYKIEEYAVVFLPPGASTNVLVSRTFNVPSGFFHSGGLTSSGKGQSGGATVESVRTDVKKELEDNGVIFPTLDNGEKATATFLAGSSKLVVRDTPDQLDVIDSLIRSRQVETPEVEIETKLAEFTDAALKALTFNYAASSTLSPGELFPGSSLIPGLDQVAYSTLPVFPPGTKANTALRDATATPGTQQPNSTALGGLTPNGIDSLLQANAPSTSTPGQNFITGSNYIQGTPNTFTLGFVLAGHGVQALVSMLDNLQGVDLLSAPTVTAKSRVAARIEIARELRYPKEFEKPTINPTVFQITDVGTGNSENVFLALPATPRQFETRAIGVILEVTPTTYNDQRIDLDLAPEVTDFEGFINYGQPIVSRTTDANPTLPAPSVANGVVNQPVFNLRSVKTKVQVLDGQTVVMGGLISEDLQKIDDKVPFLGDLPMVGRLFTSKVDSTSKRNLMIFVTARLVKSDGKPQYSQLSNSGTP